MEIDHEELLIKATEHFGRVSQIVLAMEECGELIAALAQNLRGRKSNVVEEVADVTIMMRQMTLLFGEEKVKKVISEKMKRLEKTLNNYRYV